MSIQTSTRVATEVNEDEDINQSPLPGHPVRKSKARRLVWLLILAILVVAGYYGYKAWQTKQAALAKAQQNQGPPTIPVVAEPARSGAIPVYLNGLGNVTPFNTVNIKSRVDGQLVKIAFKEGQLVKEGDLLAEIDPRPFQVQLAQAEAQLAKDQATLTNAQVDLKRYQSLADKGVIPSQQLDTQGAVVRSDQAVIKADQAQIENAKLQIVYCTIKAPVAGRIGLRQVDAGNMIHAADTTPIVVITQVQPMAVLFTIPEDSLGPVLKRLRSGEHLPVEAYDRSGQTQIAIGQLVTLDNQIDPTTGTSRLKAVFSNKDNALFPNQFVNVRLLVEVKKDEIIIPSVAIQRGPTGTFVYIVKEDQTADVRPIVAGTTEGTNTAIDQGLQAGDLVIVDGVDKLRAGSKVQVSKGNSGGGKSGSSPGGPGQGGSGQAGRPGGGARGQSGSGHSSSAQSGGGK